MIKACLTPEHEVLTTHGWVPIKNVTKYHLVAVLEDGKTLNYVHPLEIMHLNYNGEIYNVKSDKVELSVTLDHQMYVKLEGKEEFELIEAKDILNKKFSYKKDAQYNNIEEYGIGYRRYRIKQIEKILNSGISGISGISEPSEPSDNEKCLPEWIWKIPQFDAQVYAKYILARYGQGTMYRDEYYFKFKTNSKRLIDDIQRLCLHAGYISHVKDIEDDGEDVGEDEGVEEDDKTSSVNYDVNKKYKYLITLIDYTDFDPKYTSFTDFHYSNEEEITLVDYRGPVYCIEVPSHVFMVRKNFKLVWTGNCS